jgi:hypothetical protein
VSADSPNGQRKRRLQQALAAALLLALLVGLLKAASLGRSAYVLWRHGTRLKGFLSNPAAVMEPQEPARIMADLDAIEGAIRSARQELGVALRPRWLPWRQARKNLLVLDGLLQVGADLAHAGQDAAQALECMTTAIASRDSLAGNQPESSMSKALFLGMVSARQHFLAAQPAVARAAEEVAALSGDELWGPLSDLLHLLHQYLQLGTKVLDAAAAMPELLGEADKVNYMLLAQNSDELRATGGWITGIGLVTLNQGGIDRLEIQDSYAVDKFAVEHPWPPEPLTRYMGIEQWATRDGNWSPDFVTAAKDVERLYRLENPTELSGVVAFDMFAMQILLGAVGPLYLEEFQDHVTSENVIQKARDYWNPTLPEGKSWEEWAEEMGWKGMRDDWWKHRKDFMSLMAKAFVSKLQGDLQPDRLSALLWAVKSAIDEKHLLLYFHDPAVQSVLEALDIDGTLGRGSHTDYLLVLDTNMGYNKVNLNVRRSIEYQVTLSQTGAPRSELAITYSNRSPAQPACVLQSRIEPTYDLMAQDCYWNYLRVYVPEGSKLISAKGLTETETLAGENGYTVFAAFFVVPAAESKTIRFIYQLPESHSDNYELFAQKQAGTDAEPLRVEVVVPELRELQLAEPRPTSQQDGRLVYKLNLRQDRSLLLKFR